MKTLTQLSAVLFGTVMIALSFAIAAETILRKFFAISLGGIDELGGYAVALVAPVAFLVAAIERAHIRINILHARLPLGVRAALNVASAVSFGLLALLLVYFTVRTLEETVEFDALAQTPWATPLIYPQAVWLVAILVFLAVRSLVLLVRGDVATLDRAFGPGSAQEELEAELADLKLREGIA